MIYLLTVVTSLNDTKFKTRNLSGLLPHHWPRDIMMVPCQLKTSMWRYRIRAERKCSWDPKLIKGVTMLFIF